MSNKRYLAIDSTYRNRTEFPDPADFEVEISQTGLKGKLNALDPICNSMPIHSWVSNELEVGTIPSALITAQITAAPLLGSMNSNSVFIIIGGSVDLQPIDKYYVGLIVEVLGGAGGTTGERKRIEDYKYLGTNQGLFTLDSALAGILPINIEINDPTDVTTMTTAPLIYIPYSLEGTNAYAGLILFDETVNEYRPISYFNSTPRILQLDTSDMGAVVGWDEDDKFSIRRDPPLIVDVITAVASSKQFTITNPVAYGVLSSENDFYNGDFVRISNLGEGSSQTARIVDYSYNAGTGVGTITLASPLTLVATDRIEILQFSKDNYNPFIYTGSTVSQQQEVCYEIELLDLTLPNQILDAVNGSRIAFYPYVWVQLLDISTSSSGNKNILYSNNPVATNMLFRVPIDDTNNPLSSAFLKNDGDGAVQTVKFKPNASLKFAVYQPNGELFKTYMEEFFSPSCSNPLIQIAATFSLKRLT